MRLLFLTIVLALFFSINLKSITVDSLWFTEYDGSKHLFDSELNPHKDELVLALDSTLYFYDINDGDLITSKTFGDYVSQITFHPDSNYLAVELGSTTINVYDADSLNEVYSVSISPPSSTSSTFTLLGIGDIKFSPYDKKLVATVAYQDQNYERFEDVWTYDPDLETGDWRILRPKGPKYNMHFSDDGRYFLVEGSHDPNNTLEIWDGVNYEYIDVRFVDGRLNEVYFDPNFGKFLLLSSVPSENFTYMDTVDFDYDKYGISFSDKLSYERIAISDELGIYFGYGSDYKLNQYQSVVSSVQDSILFNFYSEMILGRKYYFRNNILVGIGYGGKIMGFDVDLTTSIVEINDEDILIFPNPVLNTINIEILNNYVATVEVIDLSGKTVKSNINISNSGTISTENLEPGIYFIRAKVNNKTKTIKFQKEG